MTIDNIRYTFITLWISKTDKKYLKFYNELRRKINEDFPNNPKTAMIHEFNDKVCLAVRKDYHKNCLDAVKYLSKIKELVEC